MEKVWSLLFVLCLIEGAWNICNSNQNHTCRHSISKRSLLFVKKEVCYDDLGCFSNGPPFYHPVYRPLSVVPESPDKIKTMFLLFTRWNRNRPIIIPWNGLQAVHNSTFKVNAITRMMIHGFNDNLLVNGWWFRMKDALLDRADDNVMIADWTGANRLPYTISLANTRVVGAEIARFIQYLYKIEGASPENFHLIGHSLGAHVAGYAGERLKKLGRITGLDPAGPFFRHLPSSVKLDPNDAVFVDIIHTNPGATVLEGAGTTEDAGDLDFFPDGGDPPGCDRTIVRSVFEDRPTEAFSNIVACQHLRSIEFFQYSFSQNECLFVGAECPSWEEYLNGHCNCGADGHRCAIMGLFAPNDTLSNPVHDRDRRVYLKVGPERPYCVHQYQVILYLHTLNNYKTYRRDTISVEIIVSGSSENMKGKLTLNVNLAARNHVKKVLLTTDKPIGDIKTAVVIFHRNSHPFKHNVHFVSKTTTLKSDTIVDKMEINYIYPLPKFYISSLLCRISEESNFGKKKFFLSANICH